jgi:ABC-type amino acid transport system permease subunit
VEYKTEGERTCWLFLPQKQNRIQFQYFQSNLIRTVKKTPFAEIIRASALLRKKRQYTKNTYYNVFWVFVLAEGCPFNGLPRSARESLKKGAPW